ncbi:MAG: PIN domain-containing protein [Candidatus Kerfeldbacteria bacterium]|nr:PIN domain-containing protein [Candidatus Kerfeldbacteria bacterium]
MTSSNVKSSVFFDASVLFSALYSTSGGSRALALLVQRGVLRGYMSATVIEEVERHREKFPEPLPDIHGFIVDFGFVVREHIEEDELEPWIGSVDLEDAHVIAGAVSMHADYLVSLDKKHLVNSHVQSRVTAVRIVTPKDCLAYLRKEGIEE